ncbi:MAG TPA: TadE family type IV pilus minor pilin [Acidimicrobiales bacterium]|nr:TadE family type IV pilus minor pilin [Acidimicrobiales bacterium]
MTWRVRFRVVRRGSERGQATVELALLLPVVVVLVLFIVQVAMVVRAQVLAIECARDAARAAAVDPRPDAARTAAATPGLEPGRLRVEVGRRSGGRLVHVTVSYEMPTDVSLIGPLLPDVTVHAQAVMRVEATASPISSASDSGEAGN